VLNTCAEIYILQFTEVDLLFVTVLRFCNQVHCTVNTSCALLDYQLGTSYLWFILQYFGVKCTAFITAQRFIWKSMFSFKL